ncbi:hypothetical protein C8035_v006383 [Colletotrichum spinosum]|uniref:Uncharacterized protein n=1 Tax=Colletotrichum spinosum TaxID=1347390 RepID=A0A4V3HQV4_9PEZI|nr:hypothetical protein C8035_v006383 [Colletotrichum spinosum]
MILNSCSLDINIEIIKIINNYKDYNYFYKALNKLVLHKGNFIPFLSPLRIVKNEFNFEMLLKDKVIHITKKYKNKQIKKNLIFKRKIFSNNSNYFKYILEVAC